MPTEDTLAPFDVESSHGEVATLDDLLATFWTESAVALVTGAVANVNELQTLFVSNLSRTLQGLNGCGGQAGQPVIGEEAIDM